MINTRQKENYKYQPTLQRVEVYWGIIPVYVVYVLERCSPCGDYIGVGVEEGLDETADEKQSVNFTT